LNQANQIRLDRTQNPQNLSLGGVPLKSFAQICLLSLFVLLPRTGLATEASDLCTGNPCTISGAVTIEAGSVLEFGAETDLVFAASAKVTIGPLPDPVLRRVTFEAGTITMRSGAEIDGNGAQSRVDLGALAGDISLEVGSIIDVRDNYAGSIYLKALETPGSAVTAAGELRSSATGADAQGGVISIDASGPITLSGEMILNASGADSAGGDFSAYAGGDLVVSSEITTQGGAYGGGPTFFSSTGGNIIFNGEIEASGGGPDGEAGSIDFSAPAGFVDISGIMNGKGGAGADENCGDGSPLTIESGGDIDLRSELRFQGGTQCFGGEVDITTSGSVTMHPGSSLYLRAGGSYGSGGGISIAATGNSTIRDADLTSPGGGGFVEIFSGGTTEILGELDAEGTGRDGLGGMVLLSGCSVNVAAGAEIDTRAGFVYQGLGVNEIRARGAITIAGTMLASYANILIYDTVEPTITGNISADNGSDPVITPVSDPSLDGAQPPVVLPECASACGDGTTDEGEVCDDGNIRNCDGCSSDCSRIDDLCGDGILECNESCDDENLNNGDGCEDTCQPTGVDGIRIPGTKARNGCLVQWDLVTADPALDRNGNPDNEQSCTDGDPICDQDGVINNSCAWEVSACLGVNNPEKPLCDAGPIVFAKLRKPRVGFGRDPVDLSNAAVVASALTGLGGTVKSGTTTLQNGPNLPEEGVCTNSFEFVVPVGGRSLAAKPLSVGARDAGGRSVVGNKINLACLRNDAVCGNGAFEIGERCDDGNLESCDGCSNTCNVEVCGNGTLECGEQCDDGDLNGTESSRCNLTCEIAPTDLRIPGGGSSKTDCAAEWVVETGPGGVPSARNGLPRPIAICAQGDATCDFDLAAPGCQFRLWGCFGGADERISCPAQAVSEIDLKRPAARSRKAIDLAARASLLEGLNDGTLLNTSEESCTRAMLVDVPRGSKLVIASKVSVAGSKKRDGDRLKLQCLK
jgi:cysteine-rich repeat protein